MPGRTRARARRLATKTKSYWGFVLMRYAGTTDWPAHFEELSVYAGQLADAAAKRAPRFNSLKITATDHRTPERHRHLAPKVKR